MPSTYHYGRAQFLSDVTWMGLDAEQAFSQSNLRRQRDRLMQLHHPDRGGSEEMAPRINVTIREWSDSSTAKIDKALRYAAILGTAVAVMGSGLSSLARRRR